MAEPLVRHSGSLELFGAPEYLALPGASSRWGVRGGLRAYFPVLHRGEYLSVSLGTSVLRFDDETSMAAEAGVYVLFGFLGLQLDASPTWQEGASLRASRSAPSSRGVPLAMLGAWLVLALVRAPGLRGERRRR